MNRLWYPHSIVLITALTLALVFSAAVRPVAAQSAAAKSAAAQSAESQYVAADRAYGKLKKAPERQKYRDPWLNCIGNYMAVHAHDPKGPWAAAGLYQAAKLYGELYKRSYLPADQQKAIEIFDQIIRDYPKSGYTPRARQAKAAMNGTGGQGQGVAPPATTTPAAATPSPQNAAAHEHYKQAQARYQHLQQNPSLQKYRDRWMRCIDSYRKAYQAEPEGPLAAAALYGLAECYQGLAGKSFLETDRIQASKTFAEVIRLFPDSPYAARAGSAVGQDGGGPADKATTADAVSQVIQASTPAVTSSADQPPEGMSGTPAVIEGLRYWSNPHYTRVVIDASQNAVFTYHELREDPAIGKPQRIYIDVHNSRLGPGIQKVMQINDNLLSDARAGQYTNDTVRVVVDIKSFKSYQIFPLRNPYRIVLDVWGQEAPAGAVAQTQQATLPPDNSHQVTASAIVKQLSLGVRRIVIDPGHGGRDFGAPGALKGVHEKDVVLQISKRLAARIKKELNCEVILTRDNDTYLSLEERTAIANTRDADLFISVHTNASRDPKAYGVETYILNLATDEEAIRVAAMENATSTKNISDLDSILHDLMQHAKVNESTRLASFVHNAMVKEVSKKYDQIRSKGVKQAPFYVLLGAKMPSILIETSFISNPRECRRLVSQDYQERLSLGIVEGIKRYIMETKPTALQESSHPRPPG